MIVNPKYVVCLGTEAKVSIDTQGKYSRLSQGSAEADNDILTTGLGLKQAKNHSDTGINISTEGISIKQGIGGHEASVGIATQGAGAVTFCTGGSKAGLAVKAEGETIRYAKGEANTVIKTSVISKYGKHYGIWNVTNQKVGSFISPEDQQNLFEEVS